MHNQEGKQGEAPAAQEKSKAALRAERRALQEAQKAAKAQAKVKLCLQSHPYGICICPLTAALGYFLDCLFGIVVR